MFLERAIKPLPRDQRHPHRRPVPRLRVYGLVNTKPYVRGMIINLTPLVRGGV